MLGGWAWREMLQVKVHVVCLVPQRVEVVAQVPVGSEICLSSAQVRCSIGGAQVVVRLLCLKVENLQRLEAKMKIWTERCLTVQWGRSRSIKATFLPDSTVIYIPSPRRFQHIVQQCVLAAAHCLSSSCQFDAIVHTHEKSPELRGLIEPVTDGITVSTIHVVSFENVQIQTCVSMWSFMLFWTGVSVFLMSCLAATKLCPIVQWFCRQLSVADSVIIYNLSIKPTGQYKCITLAFWWGSHQQHDRSC